MKMSTTTDKIFPAITKMQKDLENATKNRKGYGFTYADLAECISTAKEPLANNGLAVTQMFGMTEDKQATLITLLIHESGEYIGSEFIMAETILNTKGGKNPAQEMGASITYMRRYAFAAIIGMAQDDNIDKPDNKKPTVPAEKPPREKKQDEAQQHNEAYTVWNERLTAIFPDEESMMGYVNGGLGTNHATLQDLSYNEFILLNKYYKANTPVKEPF